MPKQKLYYSWSRFWSNGKDYHLFEREKRRGYTFNLNEAGMWTEKEIRELPYPVKILETKDDIRKAKTETDNSCYFIAKEQVGLLGSIHKTVRN